MIFYYIRHGDPIYSPDSLTPLGHRQAEAAARRLAVHGLDQIYASTSERARLTALPTSELLKLEIEQLDWCNEGHASRELTAPYGEGKRWLFHHPEIRPLLGSREMINLGENWYEHPAFADWDFKPGIDRIKRESDAFFASLGYEHDRENARYKCVAPNNKRIALFAHQGFGLAFLSSLLDIPYPLFATRFDLCHSSVTVIEFADDNGYCIPCVLSQANDSHIYHDGLPTKYNNRIYI